MKEQKQKNLQSQTRALCTFTATNGGTLVSTVPGMCAYSLSTNPAKGLLGYWSNQRSGVDKTELSWTLRHNSAKTVTTTTYTGDTYSSTTPHGRLEGTPSIYL